MPPGSHFSEDTHMQTSRRVGVRMQLQFAGWLAASTLFAISSPAQHRVARITAVVDDAERPTIPGTHPGRARTEDEAGPVRLGRKLEVVGIALRRTPAL